MISIGIMASSAANPDTQIEQKRAREEKDKDNRATLTATSEILFVLLPFIVIGITLAHRGEFRAILFIPEWSIVSAVIVGQSIVKIASTTLGKDEVRKEPVVFTISVLLVCLLVPILVILAIELTSQTISLRLAITQAIFFALSAVVFWFVSGLDSIF
jgi:uncharacterized membrane protein